MLYWKLDDHEIGLLPPAQFSRHFFKEDVRKGGEEEPIAVKTDFGWSILGPVNELGDTDDIDFDGVNDWCDAGVNALTDVDNVDIDHIDMSRDLTEALALWGFEVKVHCQSSSGFRLGWPRGREKTR